MERTTDHSNHIPSGSILVALGSIGFSAKPILVKLAYADTAQIDAITLMTLRMLMALPFFLLVALWNRDAETQSRDAGDWASLLVLGIAGYYLASLLDFSGLQYISAGFERLILFLYPTLVVLLSAGLYKRKIGRQQGFALILSYAGILLVYGFSPQMHSSDIAMGASLVFASAVVFALFMTGSGHFIPRFGSRRFTAHSMSIACAATLLHFLAFNSIGQLFVSPELLGLAFALALFSTVIPAFLINAGIRRIGADHASIVTSLGPVATLAMAYVVLDETLDLPQIAGSIMVLGGVLMVGLANR
jgi:drug/metabolite transporter (DMT)-like permease